MNKKYQLLFTHRCSVLIESGISLGEALEIIIKMEKSKKRKKILTEIHQNIEKGISLSRSMSLAHISIDSVLLAMMKNGETTGTLALSLKQAKESMEKSAELKRKLIGALIYPGFIALATIGMTLFLVMFIFPKIMPLLTSMNITLPLLTRIVQKVYEFTLRYGLWSVLGFVVSLIIARVLYKKVRVIRRSSQNLFLRFPIVGEAYKKYSISSYCATSAMLLLHGQSLISIIAHIANSASFESYKKSWSESYEKVSRGISLSLCLEKKQSLFPSLVSDLVSIGERTGTLSQMFAHIARIYEQELDSLIKHISVSIEPVLMIGMGIVVGSIALSIILPIYEITNHLSH